MITMNDYELYFLNNLYEDNIVNGCISEFKNQLYNVILDSKKNAQKNIITCGSLSDFKIDASLNTTYKMPAYSYSMRLPYSLSPYYSEKEFFELYGYDKPVSSISIMRNANVFNKSFHLFIDKYYIYDVRIVFNRHDCILFIPNTQNSPTDYIKNIISSSTSGEWSILWKSKSDYYDTYTTRSNLFDGTKIPIKTFSYHRVFNKEKSNHWTIHVSCGENINIMISSSATYVEDANGDYFQVSEEFKNYIYSLSTTMRCIAINECDCNGSGVYTNSSTTLPIFQIPYKKNPIPCENIIVWDYDEVNDVKMRPIISDISLSYPNIYDFTKMTSSGNIYIEWLEQTGDILSFNDYIKDYIDCYKDDFVSMMLNKTAHQKILDYKPLSIDISSENYFISEYKGDNRAWRLDKFIQILKDNPNRYDKFFEYMCEYSKEYNSVSYTYEGQPAIYNRSIMDNKDQCENAEELIILFNEPHTYIHIYNSDCIPRYCNLFINGEKRDITYNMTFGSNTYLYFPCSYIENHEDIHVDIGLDYNSKIDDQLFTIKVMSNIYRFENSKQLDTNALADLIYYIDGTNDYIDSGDIQYEIRVKQSQIKYYGINQDDEITTLATTQILEDNAENIIQPTDYDYILLQESLKDIPVTRLPHYRKIDLDNINIGFKNPKYVGKMVHVATTNFYKTNIFEYTDQENLTIPSFKGKPDKDRFHIFVNGKLVPLSTYSLQFPTYYGGDVIISNITFESGNVVVEYISYDERTIFNGKISELKQGTSNILYLDNILDIPFNSIIYKIYVDGYRVHNTFINMIGQSNAIIIQNTPFNITNDSEITIYQQCMDKDPYEYSSDVNFLSTIMKEDSTFESYMIEKYTK